MIFIKSFVACIKYLCSGRGRVQTSKTNAKEKFPIPFYQRKLDPKVVPPIPRKFREILDKADCTFSVFCLCYLELSEVNLYLMRTLTGS